MARVDKIKAKSVVPDQFWILSENNNKVGEVIKIPNEGFKVTINGKPAGNFSTLELLKKSPRFTFIDLPQIKTDPTNDVQGFPSEGLAYNAVWNVRYRLPLYTQTDDSKSWYAAGYYKVNVHGTWIVQFCPKLITLQRNEYQGPYQQNPSLNQFNKLFKS